jgi:hypothetical protein
MTRQATPTTRAGWNVLAAGLFVWLSLAGHASLSLAQPTPVDQIPESRIASLAQDLAAIKGQTDSLVARRRHLKNIVRGGQALIDESPDAPNRFEVLDIMFQSQKRLLAIDNSSRNRRTLFDISAKLAEAPDRYAEIRLEADLMLSEKELSESNATLTQRAEALAALIERYRGRPAKPGAC